MEKKLSKKDQLLESGLSIFYEKGFEKATIDDIVTKAECGKGTFYKYFKSKDEMVDALDKNFRVATRKKLEQNCPYSLKPEDFFRSLIETLQILYKENFRIGIVKFSRAHQANKFLDTSNKTLNPIPEMEYTRDYVIEKINSGELNKMEPISVVACLMGSVHYILLTYFKENKPFTSNEIDDVVKTILYGVLPA